MAAEDFKLAEPNAYIGRGVTFRGEISSPDILIVEGVVEGDITAGSLYVGRDAAVRGNVTATEADVHGVLSDNVEIKDFLMLRSTGRVEGQIRCGDFQVERGAVLAGDFTAGAEPAQALRPQAGDDRLHEQDEEWNEPERFAGLRLQAAE